MERQTLVDGAAGQREETFRHKTMDNSKIKVIAKHMMMHIFIKSNG